MNTYDLDGRKFSPVTNSQNGQVDANTIFRFNQNGASFIANYNGGGIFDGHIIGQFTNNNTANLVYHCRAADGALSAGQSTAIFSRATDNLIHIHMDWQWLNGDKSAGKSHYKEIIDDA